MRNGKYKSAANIKKFVSIRAAGRQFNSWLNVIFFIHKVCASLWHKVLLKKEGHCGRHPATVFRGIMKEMSEALYMLYTKTPRVSVTPVTKGVFLDNFSCKDALNSGNEHRGMNGVKLGNSKKSSGAGDKPAPANK